jgi:hypothetical protein
VGEKLTRYESSVIGCTVIVEQPIAHTPQFRSFSPNALPQTAKNTAVLAYRVAMFPAPKHSARIHVLPSVGSLWNQSRNILIHLRILCIFSFIHTSQQTHCSDSLLVPYSSYMFQRLYVIIREPSFVRVHVNVTQQDTKQKAP